MIPAFESLADDALSSDLDVLPLASRIADTNPH